MNFFLIFLPYRFIVNCNLKIRAFVLDLNIISYYWIRLEFQNDPLLFLIKDDKHDSLFRTKLLKCYQTGPAYHLFNIIVLHNIVKQVDEA